MSILSETKLVVLDVETTGLSPAMGDRVVEFGMIVCLRSRKTDAGTTQCKHARSTKGDPTRIGVLSGRTRPGRPGRGDKYQVKFPDTTQYVPRDQIETLPTERESPVDLLERGRFCRATDLRRTLSYPETDIGSVTRPRDIEDVPQRRRAKPERPFVGKEMV